MKANVQKLISMAVLGLALFSNSIPSWAGANSLREVIIKDFTYDSIAAGTTAGARYSSDNQQYISCYILSSSFVGCSARDKTGRSLACYGQHGKWVAAVQGITDFSQIYFVSGRDNAACYYLEIQNDSLYLK